jgi:hypothetical protein
MSNDQPMEWLYRSINQRQRAEDVADTILQLHQSHLTPSEQACLQKAAQGSLRQSLMTYTSMLQDFAAPDGLQRQVAKAIDLFSTAYRLDPAVCDQPDIVEQFIRHISQEIHKTFGQSDFKADRLNRQARSAQGMDISKRRYNKLFRHLTRMEAKLKRLIAELQKLRVTKIGKSGLAQILTFDDFTHDHDTAYFIAYYVAQMNRRSEFTIYGQQRPYDEIADMLFQRCQENPHTCWWAIAHVYPASEVLARLTDQQKGELLGQWYSILNEVATLLSQVWGRSNIERSTMIVRRGNDSSTWNNIASAWNTARSNWIALLYAMGAEEILQTICVGKVLRLMAADVVRWHASVGGQLDPDTAVWNELPLPWEVLSGQAACTLEQVKITCDKYQVDPIAKSWIAPRRDGQPIAFTATPELVHGVTVANPVLAKVLRDAGYFSGKVRQQNLPLDHELHQSTLQDHHQRLQDQNF